MGLLLSLAPNCNCHAQAEKSYKSTETAVKQPFKGFFDNKEFDIFIQLDLYGNGIAVPDHELFGELPGYLTKRRNNFCWLMTKASIKSERKAEITLINDFGSEDLNATFTQVNDSVFKLKQEDGSTLKVPNKGKWQKLPTEIEFIKR